MTKPRVPCLYSFAFILLPPVFQSVGAALAFDPSPLNSIQMDSRLFSQDFLVSSSGTG